jgi:hypothetical protein
MTHRRETDQYLIEEVLYVLTFEGAGCKKTVEICSQQLSNEISEPVSHDIIMSACPLLPTYPRVER